MSIINSLNNLMFNLTGQKSNATTVQQSLKELITYLDAQGEIKVTDDTISELLDIVSVELPEQLNKDPEVTPTWVTFGMSTRTAVQNAVTNLDVSWLRTSSLTDMSSMFVECLKVQALDVSRFDTSNVTTMMNMFNGCAALTGLNLSNFNTAKVTTMNKMFKGCAALTILDLSHFNTALCTNFGDMFSQGVHI